MTLIEKLEAKRRELDRQVRNSVFYGGYDDKAADLRDLLDAAVAGLRWRHAVRAVTVETTND
jgi:hypothetical protein